MAPFDAVGCSWCGTNPYVGCKHQSPIPRPQPLAEPPPDEPKKTDLRPFSSGGRAFAKHRAAKRKEARRGE